MLLLNKIYNCGDNMKIKISTLRSVLHDTLEFDNRSREFISSIEKVLGYKLELAPLDDYTCDLKLIFIESGGSEMLFKNNIDLLKEPYYFLTSGENNSLAATLEILTYLKTINKNGEIIHGEIDYISKRIKELLDTKEKKILDNKRYGVIGKPSDWLISSIPDYNEIKSRFGATLVDVDLSEVINGFKEYQKIVDVDPLNFDKTEVINANKVYYVLEDIIKKYHLDGFTIRCFDLLDTIKTTGCLALARFNESGIIATCEGDIMAMISMAIVKEISNASSFQANPSRINTSDNTILFAHCTVPFDMLKTYKYNTHFESGIGVAVKGELFLKDVTVFRLSKDLSRYFVSKGKIINNLELDNLCRTQILVKLEEDSKELLINPCGNHHIIFYGDYKDKIINLLKKIILHE